MSAPRKPITADGWWKIPNVLDDPRLLSVSRAARYAWVEAMGLASKRESDGVLPASDVACLDQLIDAGLVEIYQPLTSDQQRNSLPLTSDQQRNRTVILCDFLATQTSAEKRRANRERYKKNNALKKSTTVVTPVVTPVVTTVDTTVVTTEQRREEKSREENITVASQSDGFGILVERRVSDRRASRETVNRLAAAYALRYEKHAKDVWFGKDRNDREIASVARYVDAQPDRESTIADVLDGFFANPWAKENHWPWAALAKDPARFRASRQLAMSPAALEAQRKAERYAAEMAQAQADHERALAQIARG